MDRPIAFWALTVLTIVPTLATRADDRASKAEETRQKINQFSQSIVAPEMVGRNPAQDLEAWNNFQLSEPIWTKPRRTLQTKLPLPINPIET